MSEIDDLLGGRTVPPSLIGAATQRVRSTGESVEAAFAGMLGGTEDVLSVIANLAPSRVITRSQKAAAELTEVLLLIFSVGTELADQASPRTRVVPSDRFGTAGPSRFTTNGPEGDGEISLDTMELTPTPTAPRAPGSRTVVPDATPVAPQATTRSVDLPLPLEADDGAALAPAGLNSGQQTQIPAPGPASSATATELPLPIAPNPGASTAQTRSRARRRQSPQGNVTMGPMTVEDTRGPGPWRDGYRFPGGE